MKRSATAPLPRLGVRVAEWFQANPDEELTVDDIAVKFGAHRLDVISRLRYDMQLKHLVREGDTYRAGPALAGADLKKPPPARRTYRSRYAPLFERLAVGQQHELPRKEIKSVRSAVNKREARNPSERWAVRTLNAAQCVLLRLETPKEFAQ